MKRTLLITMILMLVSFPVFAEDSAGNYFQAEATTSTETITNDIQRDAYVFAGNVSVNRANIGRSLIAMGYSINVDNATIGDSLRTVSESLTVSDSNIDNNMTVAGRNIEIRGDSSANAIYGAGDTISFEGTTNAIQMYGGTVTISGTVNGDVDLQASNVVIKSTANITGNLNISSGHEPVIESGAKIGATNFDQIEPEQEQVKVKTPGEVLTETLIDIVYWTIVTVLIAFLIVIFAGRAVGQASYLLKHSLVATILTGLIGMILIPILSLVLILPYVTVPITIMILSAYSLIASICIPFAAVAIGSWALPKMNKWLSCLIFSVVFGILSRIPYLALILGLLCMIITLGYIILRLYENMRSAFKKPKQPVATTTTGATPTVTPSETSSPVEPNVEPKETTQAVETPKKEEPAPVEELTINKSPLTDDDSSSGENPPTQN